MAQVSDYTAEELRGMSLKSLANIDIQDAEEEKVIQAIVNLKRAQMPVEDVYRKDLMNNTEETPEKEAEMQKVIDQRTDLKRGFTLSPDAPDFKDAADDNLPVPEPTAEEVQTIQEEPTIETVAPATENVFKVEVPMSEEVQAEIAAATPVVINETNS